MTKYAEHILALRCSNWWEDFINEEVLPLAPEVPAYAQGKSTEEWIYGTGMKDGYLLCLKHLGVNIE